MICISLQNSVPTIIEGVIAHYHLEYFIIKFEHAILPSI
jgi:hypothetical protein